MAYDPNITIQDGDVFEFNVKAATVINRGEIVLLDTSDGTAVPGAAAAANRQFLGIAMESKDNTSGADGALTVRVRIGSAIIGGLTVVGSGGSGVLVVADIGKDLFVAGANSLSVVKVANSVPAGRLVAIESAGSSSDGKGKVRMVGYGENQKPQVAAAIAAASGDDATPVNALITAMENANILVAN